MLSVTDVDKKKTITLTTRPSILNKGFSLKHILDDSVIYGSIQSLEDHGYTVDTGLRGLTAFLPFKKVPKELEYAEGNSPF